MLFFLTVISSTSAIYIDFTMKRFCRSPHRDNIILVKLEMYVAGNVRLNTLYLTSR